MVARFLSSFVVGGGWIARVRVERTHGVLFPVDRDLLPEEIQANFGDISDFGTGAQHPVTSQESIGLVTANLANKGATARILNAKSRL